MVLKRFFAFLLIFNFGLFGHAEENKEDQQLKIAFEAAVMQSVGHNLTQVYAQNAWLSEEKVKAAAWLVFLFKSLIINSDSSISKKAYIKKIQPKKLYELFAQHFRKYSILDIVNDRFNLTQSLIEDILLNPKYSETRIVRDNRLLGMTYIDMVTALQKEATQSKIVSQLLEWQNLSGHLDGNLNEILKTVIIQDVSKVSFEVKQNNVNLLVLKTLELQKSVSSSEERFRWDLTDLKFISQAPDPFYREKSSHTAQGDTLKKALAAALQHILHHDSYSRAQKYSIPELAHTHGVSVDQLKSAFWIIHVFKEVFASFHPNVFLKFETLPISIKESYKLYANHFSSIPMSALMDPQNPVCIAHFSNFVHTEVIIDGHAGIINKGWGPHRHGEKLYPAYLNSLLSFYEINATWMNKNFFHTALDMDQTSKVILKNIHHELDRAIYLKDTEALHEQTEFLTAFMKTFGRDTESLLPIRPDNRLVSKQFEDLLTNLPDTLAVARAYGDPQIGFSDISGNPEKARAAMWLVHLFQNSWSFYQITPTEFVKTQRHPIDFKQSFAAYEKYYGDIPIHHVLDNAAKLYVGPLSGMQSTMQNEPLLYGTMIRNVVEFYNKHQQDAVWQPRLAHHFAWDVTAPLLTVKLKAVIDSDTANGEKSGQLMDNLVSALMLFDLMGPGRHNFWHDWTLNMHSGHYGDQGSKSLLSATHRAFQDLHNAGWVGKHFSSDAIRSFYQIYDSLRVQMKFEQLFPTPLDGVGPKENKIGEDDLIRLAHYVSQNPCNDE